MPPIHPWAIHRSPSTPQVAVSDLEAALDAQRWLERLSLHWSALSERDRAAAWRRMTAIAACHYARLTGVATSEVRLLTLAADTAVTAPGAGDSRALRHLDLYAAFRRNPDRARTVEDLLGLSHLVAAETADDYADFDALRFGLPQAELDVTADWFMAAEPIDAPALFVPLAKALSLEPIPVTKLHNDLLAGMLIDLWLAETGIIPAPFPLLLLSRRETGRTLHFLRDRRQATPGYCAALQAGARVALEIVSEIQRRRIALDDRLAAIARRSTSRADLVADCVFELGIASVAAIKSHVDRMSPRPISHPGLERILAPLIKADILVEITGRRSYRAYSLADELKHLKRLTAEEPLRDRRSDRIPLADPAIEMPDTPSYVPPDYTGIDANLKSIFDDVDAFMARVEARRQGE